MRYGLAALSLVLVVGLLYGLHTSAVRNARSDGAKEATIQCIQAIDKAIEDAKKQRQKVEYRNARLSDLDLDQRLSRWMRTDD